MADNGKVLVTGATGNTGSGLVPLLKNAGVDVRAFARDESKTQVYKQMGIDVFIGDLDQPETIPPALDGVDKLYLCTWNGPTQAQQAKSVIAAAQEAGDIYIVRHSMWGSEKSRIVKQGDEVEEALKSSGLPWTILSPTFYMQNFLGAVQSIAADGMLYWDMGDGKLSMIDVRDIVESAYAVLTGSGHEGKSYRLTGPEAVSLHDVAEAFSKALDKEVKYVSVPGEAALETRVEMGFPEWIAKGYEELMVGFSQGFADSTTDNVEKLTGHPARSIEDFTRDYAQIFSG